MLIYHPRNDTWGGDNTVVRGNVMMTAQQTQHVGRAVSAASNVPMLAQRCVHWTDTDKALEKAMCTTTHCIICHARLSG